MLFDPGARGAPSTIKLRETEAPAAPKAEALAPMSKAALKNKKKRDKAKAAAAGGAGGNDGDSDGSDDAPSTPAPAKAKAVSSARTSEQKDAVALTKTLLGAAPAAAPVAAAAASGSADGGGSELDKKHRAVSKKLRQIEQLKEKQAGGEFLQVCSVSLFRCLPCLTIACMPSPQANQLEKVATEADVKKELAEIEKLMAALALHAGQH